MAEQQGKKKKAKAKSKTVSLNEFLSGDGNTPPLPVRTKSWADETNDLEEEDISVAWTDTQKSKPPVDLKNLPSAPRAATAPNIDLSRLPKNPPFTVFLGNLSYEASEDDVSKHFEKHHLTARTVRLLKDKDGRLKGFGYVEFESLANLVEALSLKGTVLKGRQLQVDVAEGRNDGGGNDDYGGGRGGNRYSTDDDRTTGNWRSFRNPSPPGFRQYGQRSRSPGYHDRGSGGYDRPGPRGYREDRYQSGGGRDHPDGPYRRYSPPSHRHNSPPSYNRRDRTPSPRRPHPPQHSANERTPSPGKEQPPQTQRDEEDSRDHPTQTESYPDERTEQDRSNDRDDLPPPPGEDSHYNGGRQYDDRRPDERRYNDRRPVDDRPRDERYEDRPPPRRDGYGRGGGYRGDRGNYSNRGRDYGGDRGRDYGGDRGRDYGGDRGREYGGDRGRDFGGDRGRDFGGDRGRDFGGDRGRDFGGDRGRDFGGDRGRDYGGDRGRDYGGDRGRDYGGDRGRDYGGDRGRDYGGDRGRDYGGDRGNYSSRGREFGDRGNYGNRGRDYGGDRGGRRDDHDSGRFNRRGQSPQESQQQEEVPRERKKLQLQPRTKPSESSAGTSASSIFGGAKPVDTAKKEREIEEKMKKKETEVIHSRDKQHGGGRKDSESSEGGQRRLPSDSDDTRAEKRDENRGRKGSHRGEDQPPLQEVEGGRKGRGKKGGYKGGRDDDRGGRDHQHGGGGGGRGRGRGKRNTTTTPHENKPPIILKKHEEQKPVEFEQKNRFAGLEQEDEDEQCP